jgi:hypothetical protein
MQITDLLATRSGPAGGLQLGAGPGALNILLRCSEASATARPTDLLLCIVEPQCRCRGRAGGFE